MISHKDDKSSLALVPGPLPLAASEPLAPVFHYCLKIAAPVEIQEAELVSHNDVIEFVYDHYDNKDINENYFEVRSASNIARSKLYTA